MTKHIVIAIRDSAIAAFSPPILSPRAAYGIRQFTDEVNRADDKNPLYVHPDDYELHQLATFDDETGVYEAAHAVLCRAKDVHRGD